MTSEFLVKHSEIAEKLKAEYPDFSIYKNEVGIQQGSFPAIGFFLGMSVHSKDALTYTPTFYTYILGVFDTVEIDDTDGFEKTQQDTFEMLEKIITEQGFEVLTEIDSVVALGYGEGSFIAGWNTTIKKISTN